MKAGSSDRLRRRRASADVPRQSFDYKREIWQSYHHRFGLAGEGQADTIERILDAQFGSVLNVGCGPWGTKLEALGAHCGSLTAVDRESEAIRLARREAPLCGAKLVVADAQRLPFCDRAFDHVIALGLFAHIADPKEVFREIHRVCRTGAHVFVTNAVRHRVDRYEDAGTQAGLTRVHYEEGYCPAASGELKRRYLLVFNRGPRDAHARRRSPSRRHPL